MLTKVEITYLQAGIFIKEIINMLSPKGNRLSDDDDVAAKLLINNIFGGILNDYKKIKQAIWIYNSFVIK